MRIYVFCIIFALSFICLIGQATSARGRRVRRTELERSDRGSPSRTWKHAAKSCPQGDTDCHEPPKLKRETRNIKRNQNVRTTSTSTTTARTISKNNKPTKFASKNHGTARKTTTAAPYRGPPTVQTKPAHFIEMAAFCPDGESMTMAGDCRAPFRRRRDIRFVARKNQLTPNYIKQHSLITPNGECPEGYQHDINHICREIFEK